MGIMGLMAPWANRIGPVLHQEERRLEPFHPGATDVGAAPADTLRAEDKTLAAECRSGDLRAYERVYAMHGARMKNLARNLLGNPTDAEDAVQETFIKLQRSIGTFRGRSSFATWIFRILVNTCYDARRSRMRKKEFTVEGENEVPPEPRSPGAHPSLRLALERAVATLTRQQRNVFLLYEVEGFRHAEIAEMLAISETASKNTLFQAKKNLRQLLDAPRGSGALGAR